MTDQETAPAQNFPARNYHEATKLAYINLANKPPLYNSYPNSPTIPLPTDYSLPQLSTLKAIAGDSKSIDETINLETVASLLYLSAGVIRKAIHSNGRRGALPGRRLGWCALPGGNLPGLPGPCPD